MQCRPFGPSLHAGQDNDTQKAVVGDAVGMGLDNAAVLEIANAHIGKDGDNSWSQYSPQTVFDTSLFEASNTFSELNRYLMLPFAFNCY